MSMKTITIHREGDIRELAGAELYVQLLTLRTGILVNQGEEAFDENEETGHRTAAVEVDDTVTGWHALVVRETDGDEIAANYFADLSGVDGSHTDAKDEVPPDLPVPQPLFTPIYSNTRTLLTPGRLEARTREARRHRIPIFADKQPVDLRQKELQFALKLSSSSTIAVNEFDIEGADHNIACFVVPASAHQTAGQFEYAVRDLQLAAGEKDLTWSEGVYEVKDVPGPVAIEP